MANEETQILGDNLKIYVQKNEKYKVTAFQHFPTIPYTL